jgi:hypothetical protein
MNGRLRFPCKLRNARGRDSRLFLGLPGGGTCSRAFPRNKNPDARLMSLLPFPEASRRSSTTGGGVVGSPLLHSKRLDQALDSRLKQAVNGNQTISTQCSRNV